MSFSCPIVKLRTDFVHWEDTVDSEYALMIAKSDSGMVEGRRALLSSRCRLITLWRLLLLRCAGFEVSLIAEQKNPSLCLPNSSRVH